MNTIQLHADWTRRCVIDSNSLPWQASPSPLVERRMLERDGGELARATSIVRYAPGARFDAHRHDLGEEILVLEGTFSDASGDYGPGSYLRNPPGTGHAPWSRASALRAVFSRARRLPATRWWIRSSRSSRLTKLAAPAYVALTVKLPDILVASRPACAAFNSSCLATDRAFAVSVCIRALSRNGVISGYSAR